MASIEIADVTVSDLDTKQLWRRNIEAPKPGGHTSGDAFTLVGWVIGRSNRAVGVEVVHKETVIESVPVEVNRPDVATAFPDIRGAEQSGFRTTVTIPDTGENELLVQAVLQDESRVPLGTVRTWRHQSSEEQDSNSSVQGESGPLGRFFRHVFRKGGG